MPRFIVEAQYQDDEEPTIFGCDFSIVDDEFLSQHLDLGEVLYAAKGSHADITLITAAESIGSDINEGDVVWRDWYDVDLTTVDARKQAIQLAVGTKALWHDRGTGFDVFTEILCPQPWEVKEYGMRAEDGFVIS